MIDTIPPDFYTEFVSEVQDEIDEVDMVNIRAFTWTPDPSKYPSSIPRKQYKTLLQHILLNSFKYFRLYCFVPELNENGNVHIHGWYIIKDQIKYYKMFLPKCKQLGFVYVKSKVDEYWLHTYLCKTLRTSIGVIGDDLPIPLTHLNNKAYFKKPRVAKCITDMNKAIDKDIKKNKSILDFIDVTKFKDNFDDII